MFPFVFEEKNISYFALISLCCLSFTEEKNDVILSSYLIVKY